MLLERAFPPNQEYIPKSVLPFSFAALRATLQRLIPQAEDEEFVDIAMVLDSRRALGSGDGWRYANMPSDAFALVLDLEFLETAAQAQHAAAFTSLDPADQDALLDRVQKGGLTWPGLDARRWFEDLLAEAMEIYVLHRRSRFATPWGKVDRITLRPLEPQNSKHGHDL